MTAEPLRVSCDDEAAIVTLPEEIDVLNAAQVREDLLAAIGEGNAVVIADMTATRFCDSAGLATIIRASRRASASGTVLRLAVHAPAVRRVLSLTGIDQRIQVFPTPAECLPDAS
jgi:anti-sigma B factor antagonist